MMEYAVVTAAIAVAVYGAYISMGNNVLIPLLSLANDLFSG